MVIIDRKLYGTRVETTLPNLDYHPGLVSLRRCDDCSELDRRTWYTSAEQAAEKDAQRNTTWKCPACAGERGTIVRGWFDTVYAVN